MADDGWALPAPAPIPRDRNRECARSDAHPKGRRKRERAWAQNFRRGDAVTNRHTPSRRPVNTKGRNPGPAKHVRFYRWMLECAAWKATTAVERAILIELYSLFNGENNGDIYLSCREAGRRVNCSKNTARRAFDNLIDDIQYALQRHLAFERTAKRR